MPWTTITKPTQGDATKKSLVDTIIDNLAFLFGRLTGTESVINGSFENDTDSDGIPDGWTRTLYTGGTFLLDNTDQRSGKYAIKFTSPGGAGNGGGYIENTDAFPVSPNRAIQVLWEMKSSAAGVSNKIEVYWFKSDLTASATPSTSLYSSTSNPTIWNSFTNRATPPSDARYAKIRLTGCHTSSTTAGSTWFDNILWRLEDFQIPVFELITATGTWTCPNNVTRVRVRMWGGGGGGDTTGGGGGAGGYAEFIQTVVPTTGYTVTIGGGGAVGAAGGNTTFDATTANGGAQGGVGAGGTGGAGAGTYAVAGGDGKYVSTTPTESGGGNAPLGGRGGSTGGVAGSIPGGGGGRNAAGAAGRILLEY
jgi:hypothetical protein